MNKHYLIVALSMVLLLTTTSCDILFQLFDKTPKEAIIAQDATPPPGYNPIYILKSKTYPGQVEQGEVKFNLFRTEIDPNLVKMYVQVTDTTGNYLTGLTDPEFKKMWCVVSDSIAGKRTQLTDFKVTEITEEAKVPYAIALVLDHSGSMGVNRAKTVQNAVENFIRNKKDEDAVSIIKYDTDVVVEVPLTKDKNTLLSGFRKNGLEGYGRMTAAIDATQRGINELKNATGYQRKVVVVFTDGKDNISRSTLQSLVKSAQEEEIIICAFDFGIGVQKGFLESMTVPTNGSYYHTYYTQEFNFVFEDIYRRLKNYYIVEFQPLTYGKHEVTVELCTTAETLKVYTSYDNTPDVGKIALLNVNFDFDKDVLKASSGEAIENVLLLMKSVPSMKIELRGHTDSVGDPTRNQNLSERRALAVKKRLVQEGIDESRITYKGFGDTRPVATNETAEGRALNRRTEFVIISK